MALEKKHIALIVGSILLIAAVGIYFIWIKPPGDEKTEPEENTKGGSDQGTQQPATPVQTSNSSVQNGQVVPIFNEENELANSLDQLLGRVLYPKRAYLGGWDYANVRNSAEVNTDTGWFDFSDNLLTTISAGTPIGTVTAETSTILNEHAYRWFKVRLIKPAGFWAITVGYVRADTVTFQPY